MADYHQTIAMFVEHFKRALDNCPLVTKEFYNSFEYTRTGKNLSHPRTVGLLVQACFSMPEVVAVDVDVRLNKGGTKFQPDVIARKERESPMLMIDFESPNSSDARVPRKDVEAYAKWTSSAPLVSPYLIITSLPREVGTAPPPALRGAVRPRAARSTWELRYASASGCNYEHREFGDLIRSNPFAYWYREYRGELKKLQAQNPSLKDLPFYFANLDGLELELVDVWKF